VSESECTINDEHNKLVSNSPGFQLISFDLMKLVDPLGYHPEVYSISSSPSAGNWRNDSSTS